MKEKLIIMITRSLWNEPHRGRHHFADVLSEDNTVIWINRPYSWKNSKFNKFGSNLKKIKSGLYVLEFGKLLPNRLNKKLNLNNLLRLWTLKKKMNNLNLPKPDIIWTHDYQGIQFVKTFRENAKTIYFCNDYFGRYVYNKYEINLARNVDYVISTAPKLKCKFEKHNSNSYFLPHGTSFFPQTIEFKKKGKPKIVGYVGTFRNVIDINFLWKILNNTEFELVLAGPIIECSNDKEKSFKKLFRHKKVKYYGEVNKENIFNVLKEIDICLLPYICTEKTKHNFVIKFFEYLSMGKPIFATPYFDWPKKFGYFIEEYNNNFDVESSLNNLYKNWDIDFFNKARNLAMNSTWENRVDQLFSIITGKKQNFFGEF